MMAATHGFLSLAAVTALLPVLPAEVGAPAALAAALAGGVAPDADLLWTHRRTLHFPVLAPLVATVLATVALVTGLPALVLAAVAAGAAGLHALTDLLGGSAEREPWNPSTEHGVYNHVTGRWHRPRRLVPYSGAPEDFLLAAVAAALAALPAATSPPRGCSPCSGDGLAGWRGWPPGCCPRPGGRCGPRSGSASATAAAPPWRSAGAGERYSAK
jgi:hypothetical protein